jgi:acetolactate decarboxylase
MKYIWTLFVLFTSVSMTTMVDKDESFKVEYHGALKNMMHQGDLSAQANLKDFENLKHFYALGAVAGLKGEILILDGQAYISSANGTTLRISNSFNHEAALLVHATVARWTSFEVPDSIRSYKDLEKHMERAAKDFGIDTDQPFPFLVKGILKSFNWHVINWKDGDKDHSHEKHIKSGPNGKVAEEDVEILGFYSNSHHGIFTHHSTNMHLHLKTVDNKISAHLDDLTLGEKMTLWLPALD